jgi:methionyl-tRNA formyltransferase
MKILFAGTPEFAAVALQSLIDSGEEIVAVYTQPDRPAGRGQKLHPSPVKTLALAQNISVFQPVSLKNSAEQVEMQALGADVMIVAAYGLILPAAVLSSFEKGCFNIHASLLPRWRGAAPIQRAILAGDIETGITIMQMDVGLDTGDMLLKKTCAITPKTTANSLHDQLSLMGAEAIIESLQALKQNALKPEKQDATLATYAKKILKAESQINWNQGAGDIDRHIRAFHSWPVASSHYRGQCVRIWAGEILPSVAEHPPGTIVSVSKMGLDVACADQLFRIQQIQFPGGKRLVVSDFLNAKRDVFTTLSRFDG